LILLPFAENCFKHGGQGEDGYFRIKVNLKADHSRLVFLISNSKPMHKQGTDLRIKEDVQNGGVGLENIRQRLLLLYPKSHELIIEETESEYRVKLAIDFRNETV
jgi:sensor histidine kinase YesM